MNIKRLMLAAGILISALPAFGQPERPLEEVIVAGRQPGPPMWRVSRGENVLWIFPQPDLVPRQMIWDSSSVEAVVADSQEALSMPDVDIEMSKLVMLNPINIIRGIRLGNRIRENPNEAKLEEVVPEELYVRFSALKAEYFPRHGKIDDMRPVMAAATMVDIVQRESDLVSGAEIGKTIRRLTRRNKDIRHTEIETSLTLEGNFRSLAQRIETMMASLSPEQEVTCFEAQVTRMETDLGAARRRANAWALGDIDEFRRIPLPGSDNDVCTGLMLASSEGETLEELLARQNRQWLDAAETALARNRSTFAVLSISTLLQADGPITQLKAAGYDVREP